MEAEQKKEDRECTFRPKILRGSPASRTSREQWLHNWGQQRNMKVAQIQQNEALRSLEECTFSPKINVSMDYSRDNCLEQSSKGAIKFLERQESARKKRSLAD